MALDDDRGTRSRAPALAALPAAELLAIARAEGVSLLPNLARGELLAAILTHRLAQRAAVPADGVLELLPEGFGFLRSPWFDYEASPADAFVSPSQVRALNLKPGQRVRGPLRAPKGSERFVALVHVDEVDGADAAGLALRLAFAARTPIVPKVPLALAAPTAELRALALLAPWQLGQRVLVTAPPALPRAAFLARLAAAMRAANPDLTLTVCLLDQRPEDLAAARAQSGDTNGVEVVGTTFDAAPERHVALADIVLARCQRLVEAGRDVVLLFDSLTALTHARQREQPASGRWLCPGLDAQAVLPGKRLFAAARACAEGGSLTVIATALHATGAAIDDAVLAEFRHRGNSEVVVDGALAAAGAAVPFDAFATRTRPEEDRRDGATLAAVRALRERLAGADASERERVLAALAAP